MVENNTGTIRVIKPLDRENVTSPITIRMRVSDCTVSKQLDNSCLDITPSVPTGKTQKIELKIEVLDVDDNPPVFINRHIATGMKRDVKPETLLELSLKVMFVDETKV